MKKLAVICCICFFAMNFKESLSMKIRPMPKRTSVPYFRRTSAKFNHLPLIIPDIPKSEIKQEISPLPNAESYDFYLPADESHILDSETQLYLALSPPGITNEPNYYSLKSKKVPKKFSSYLKYRKYKPVHEDNSEDRQAAILYTPPPKISEDGISRNISYNTGEIPPDGSESDEQEEEVKENKPDRIEYQVHGHDGPKSYKFGYDTGTGKDRQFRYEIRDKDGRVEGEYGYLDKGGKLIKVKYTSTAEEGFKIETKKD